MDNRSKWTFIQSRNTLWASFNYSYHFIITWHVDIKNVSLWNKVNAIKKTAFNVIQYKVAILYCFSTWHLIRSWLLAPENTRSILRIMYLRPWCFTLISFSFFCLFCHYLMEVIEFGWCSRWAFTSNEVHYIMVVYLWKMF